MTRIRTLLLACGAAVVGLAVVAAPAGAQHKHDCSYCHDLHGASYPQLTARDLQVDLCSYCHDPDGLQGPTVDGKTIPWQGRNADVGSGFVDHIDGTVGISCWDCHDHEGEAVLPTGGTNLVMIGDSVTTPSSGRRPVVFTAWSGTNSFADGDLTYDGICEVCHTQTTFHLNLGGGLPHNGGADCTTCHKHDTGFQGAGGCTGCHSISQGGRRPIVGEFDRMSHHIDLAAAGYPSSADIPDSQCEACHELSQHQQGSVRLKNADAPLIVYSLTGDPTTDATEAAKLTAFCLACHDADGAGGAPPFGDGVAPPVIDNNAWTSSSHGAGAPIAGCYGDGAFGCHATGHGSQKTTLLAPAGVPATAPAYAEQEEGFCFNCHDSDGPSTKDVKSGYDTAILWSDGGVQFGPADLNDRHDVKYATQQTSQRKVECTNCHDPHTANNTARPFSLVRTDPDPTDGRIPGTGWFADSSGGLATDAISEFCLDCHDGSWAPGVQDNGATKIVDILHGVYTGGTGSSWYENSHGAGPSGASLKTGTNYWALDAVVSCVACHQAHPGTSPQPVNSQWSNNLFAMRDWPVGTDFATHPSADGTPFELTTQTVRRDDSVNGYYLCNTCHTGSMGSGKSNCFDCHVHGDNRF